MKALHPYHSSIQAAAIAIAILLFLSVLLGCASTAKYDARVEEQQALCDHEAPDLDECNARAVEIVEEEIEYEKYERQLRREEKLYLLVQQCKASGHAIVYSCRFCSSAEIRKMHKADRKGQIYIPKGASKITFGCASRAEIDRMMRDMRR